MVSFPSALFSTTNRKEKILIEDNEKARLSPLFCEGGERAFCVCIQNQGGAFPMWASVKGS